MNNIGDMLIEIGSVIKKYQNQIQVSDGNQILLKAKEVLERYPVMSNYGLNEAVKKGAIPIVKIGKLNFYDVKDIEKYISNNKIRTINNEQDETKKYV